MFLFPPQPVPDQHPEPVNQSGDADEKWQPRRPAYFAPRDIRGYEHDGTEGGGAHSDGPVIVAIEDPVSCPDWSSLLGPRLPALAVDEAEE